MNELKMRRVESDASHSPFQFFSWIVLPVTDDRVADRRQLDTDLICNPVTNQTRTTDAPLRRCSTE